MRIAFIAAAISCAGAEWVNRKINREMALRENAIVEVKMTYNVESKGDSGPYKLAIPEASKVGTMRISSGGKDLVLGEDFLFESRKASDDVVTYQIDQKSISEGSIEVKTFLGNMLSPFPTKVMELESQQVLLTTVLAIPSEYVTETQSTTITVPDFGGDIVSVRPSALSKKMNGRKVEIGPLTPSILKSVNEKTIKVHVPFDKPLPVLTSTVKTIEISQLGQVVAVNEDLTLVNKAAALNGEFSRTPYIHMKYAQGNQQGFTLGHTLQATDAIVPVTAFDIHYRDVIGNISSSSAKRESDLTRVNLRPRFPLLGSWKTEFSFMYNLPFSSEKEAFIKQKGTDEFLLSVPLSHSLSNIFAENLEVKLILPAGASDIRISLPGRHVESLRTENMFGWIDTPLLGPESGRTVITFSAGPSVAGDKNSVKNALFVTYRMSPLALLKAPVLLTLYIFAIFLMLIASRRVVMQITNPKEAIEEENKSADHDLCEAIDDELTNLWVLTGELLDVMKEDKAQITEFKQRFLERYAAILAKVDALIPQFTIENNRVDRAARLMSSLKTVKEASINVLDTAAAGRDISLPAGKLVDAEAEAKLILVKVESGAPPSAPASPTTATSSGKGVTSTATAMKKRR
jgi:oligosaccharyltransferase complex subunit alpha (ribophorin I)